MPFQRVIEKQMDKYLVKRAPYTIPKYIKALLVRYMSIISLIGGLLSLIALIGLWRMANKVGLYNDAIRDLALHYGEKIHSVDYGLLFYIAMSALFIQSMLLIAAYKPLVRQKTLGWNLLLYSVFVNVTYSLFYMFTDVGTLGNLLLSLVGALFSLYLLAQIKSFYNKKS